MKNVADIYALSPMQQLMLLHAKTAVSEQDVLFNQIVYCLRGNLQPEAYKKAWQLLVDRHSALRTIFVWQDGKDPLQVVREKATLPWAELDWRHLSTAVQQEELEKVLAADRAQGFNLLSAPLMRLTLIQLADHDYKLIWSSHHLIIDRWCIGILFDELKIAYDAITADTLPSLAPAPRFSDYIAWLAEQDLAEAKAYWHESLYDAQVRPLPLQARTNEEEYAQDEVQITLTGEDWHKLRRFALKKNLTSSTLLIGAWAIVLSAANGADEALFGLTVSGRPADLPLISSTIGCFINNVPLHVSLKEDSLLVPWLETLQEKQLGLKPYEYASPAQIQTWSSIKPTGPLFDTLVVLQAPFHQAMPEGLEVKFDRGGTQTGYPIGLGAMPGQERLELTLTYDRQRVPVGMIQQIASALERVLLALPVEKETLLREMLVHGQSAVPVEKAVPVIERNGRSERPFIPFRTTTEQALFQIWAEVLGLSRVSAEDRFYELGGDSIRTLQLFSRIEQKLGKELPISIMFGDPTLAQMADAIGEDATELPKDPALVPLNIVGSRPPVFFTHGVFGSLVWLTNILPLLDPDQPAYGLQSAGLQPDIEPDTTVETMAARYVAAMRRVQPSGPYYIAGFCFGGIVAYEIARQLEQSGEKIALLVIIDAFPSQEVNRKRPLYDPLRLRIVRESAPYWVQGYKEFGGWRFRERIQSMLRRERDPQEEVNINTEKIGEFDYLADFTASGPENQHLITEINHRAGDLYKPQTYGGQVTLFCARLLGVNHALLGPVDPHRGWDKLAMGGVAMRSVAGSHVGLLTNPYVSDLAAQLNDVIRSAMTSN